MNTIDISGAYKRLLSIKAVARELKISESTVRKTLITAGLYESDTTRMIRQLADQGKTPDEIAKITSFSTSCVNANLPYTRGQYKSDNPTQNAIRIARWRKGKV